MRKARISLLLATGALAAVVCAAQVAGQKSKSQPAATNAARRVYGPLPAPAVAGGGGLIAIVDPETQAVRQATPAEIGAANARVGSSITIAPPAPQVHYGPGNGVGVKLNGAADVFSVMTKGPDGKLQMECVTGEKAANQRIASPTKREALDEK